MELVGEARMRAGERRFALRAATSGRHAELDGMIGDFATLEDYRRYLNGQFAFRAAMEQAFEKAALPGGWRPTPAAEAMREDFRDRGWQTPVPLPAPVFHSADEWLGAAYVLQGASLGAQLLLRRAPALGLSGEHGARHLAVQAGALGEWRHFLSLLDEASSFDPAKAAGAALAVFDLAIRAARDAARAECLDDAR
ncbi:biliverdin-producing heme oxygenase [Acetobacteraceae bacterium H6797]|nr:biliverdin-producing heme oxygenase [Acetobacteraceae bacterium H6797]